MQRAKAKDMLRQTATAILDVDRNIMAGKNLHAWEFEVITLDSAPLKRMQQTHCSLVANACHVTAKVAKIERNT